MNSGVDNYLVVGAILFALGALGFVTRRNLILMILSAELMLHGVSLNLVAFAHQQGNDEGQVFAIFIITVAACEAGLGLALILGLYQRRRSLDISVWRDLGEPLPKTPPDERGAAPTPVRKEAPAELPRPLPVCRDAEVPQKETVTHA
jgi:NADH-quinone oxidoreductase subunit K